MQRAGLALLLIAAFASPALAQKNPPPGPSPAAPAAPTAPASAAASVATAVAATCLRFANGDGDATSAAEAEGWTVDAYPDTDSFLFSLSASRSIAGVGDANLFGSIETYPNFTLRFCRVDITTNADAGPIGVETLNGWEGFAGTVKTTGTGTYGSWDKTMEDPDRVMLMTAQQNSGVTLQINAITAEAAN